MEEKQEKLDKEKKDKIFNLSIKQEADYIKQYLKKQNILRLERINKYKTNKRNEELLEKEKKIQFFKNKKDELIKNKAKLAKDMEREKQRLINKFEKAVKKRNQVDPEIVKDLFPEDEVLYNKIKCMTTRMYKTTYNLSKRFNNSCNHSKFNGTSRYLEK